ncbi:hypothetical protein DFH29DRAFT_551493 [Suillus ampliporus]|nr:hypothetical protein DFH29DRAFT_551493 [Suillus ampliporus]
MTVIANSVFQEWSSSFLATITCGFAIDTDKLHLSDETLIPIVIWEILALCLAVWIVIKHFRELRQLAPTGSTIGDCFTVLIRSHVLYFVAFVVGSCCRFGAVSTNNHIASVVGAGFITGLSK